MTDWPDDFATIKETIDRLTAERDALVKALQAMLDHHTGLGHSPAVQLARAALALVQNNGESAQ
jgi:hypothetical protein